MSDETPDQVTLDDLPPIGWADPYEHGMSVTGFQMCTRCAGVVYSDDRGEALAGHERWHAAIEDAADPRLSTIRRSELDRLVKTMAAGAAASAQPEEFQPLRDQLILRIKEIDQETSKEVTSPVHWADRILPLVEAWAEKYLSRATTAEAKVEELAEQRDQMVRNWRAELSQALGSSGRELSLGEALSRVEFNRKHMDEQSSVIQQLRTDPPFGLREQLLDALQVQDTGQDIVALVRELRTEYGKLEQKLEQPRVTDELAAKIRQATSDPGSFVDRIRDWDDRFDRWQYESIAAWGARAVLAVLNPPADEDEPAEGITDEQLSNLLLLVGVTPSAAQLSSWTPEQREQAANWAGAVHLDASDNDVDVPECPGFLVPDRFPGVFNVRSLNDTGNVWMCSRCGRRTGMMGHPNGCPKPAAEAEMCPSLYLHDGTLLPCTLDPDRHTDGNYHVNGDRFDDVGKGLICWAGEEAVLVPWPLDQEPPAGITLLHDQDDEDSGREPPMPYVLRAINGWRWSEKADGTGKLGPRDEPWSEIARAAEGELHVVRP